MRDFLPAFIINCHLFSFQEESLPVSLFMVMWQRLVYQVQSGVRLPFPECFC